MVRHTYAEYSSVSMLQQVQDSKGVSELPQTMNTIGMNSCQ